MATPEVSAFYDPPSGSLSYVVADGGHCVIIDPVRDFDPVAARTGSESVERLLAHVAERGLVVDWILETHIHADHLSGAALLKERLGSPIGAGTGVVTVQRTFRDFYDLGEDFVADGGAFDHLFGDGVRFRLGGTTVEVLHTPGHTPACVSYRIGDAVFVGDTLFMPDSGTARCDFPGGDAAQLYRSIRRLLGLPAATRLFVCHDYGAEGARAVAWESSVAEQRAENIHVGGDTDEARFVALRRARDAGLAPPRLMLAAIQVNIRAGRLPPPAANGTSYLKIPLDAL